MLAPDVSLIRLAEIGTALLRLAEQEVRRRGIEVLWLGASSNAEEFYLHLGYEPVGPRPPDDARPMRKRLTPVAEFGN